MDILPVNAPSGLNPVAAISTQIYVPPAPPSASETVDISAAGRLLSASILFEAATTNDFATVAVATQYFVNALNNFLQSDSLQSSTVGSLNNLFTQMLNAGASTSGLFALGINLSSAASGQITVNYQTLEAAYAANPSGTLSQLTQATLSIGQLASQFTTLAAQLESLSQPPLTSTATPAATTPATAAATPSAPAQTATVAATTLATPATTPTTTPATTPATTVAASATPATTFVTTAIANAPAAAQATNPAPGSATINSADPAIAAAIASYHIVDGVFDMAKPHDKGPAPKTPVYSEIGNITPVQPVVLNLHG